MQAKFHLALSSTFPDEAFDDKLIYGMEIQAL